MPEEFLKPFTEYSLTEAFLFIICVIACIYVVWRIWKGGF